MSRAATNYFIKHGELGVHGRAEQVGKGRMRGMLRRVTSDDAEDDAVDKMTDYVSRP